MNNLNIISEDKAKQWEKSVEALNLETRELLDRVGETLQRVKDDADSTVVDEIYKYGSQILENTHNILNGMNQICNIVNSLLASMLDILDKGKEIVKGAVRSFLG